MNKFKVGDRVKSILKEEYYGIRYGDIGTVKEDSTSPFVIWDRTNKLVAFYERNLLKVYTYEDLRKAPIGTKVTFEKNIILVKTSEKRLERGINITDIENLKNLKDEDYGKIIKIEEPKYETIYEYKEEILDEAEKRYLRGVIRPFRNRITYIMKMDDYSETKEYIYIDLGNEAIDLPDFNSESMYKGMKLNKEYTLEELGL